MYKCYVCKKQFLGGKRIIAKELLAEYIKGKQTYNQLAQKYNCSKRTIQRKIDLYQVSIPKKEPRKVVILMDTTKYSMQKKRQSFLTVFGGRCRIRTCDPLLVRQVL